MSAYDVFRKIASNLSERKSSAALSNYEILGNNIKYVNGLLKSTIDTFSDIQASTVQSFTNSNHLNEDFRETGALYPFIKIVPRILANGSVVLEKFSRQTEPDDRSDININNVGRLQRGFFEYNELVTSARQIVDSLISDAYQLCLLDPKSLNYHVLVSLNSFDKYVTRSIKQALFNPEVSDALVEFRKLPFRDWNNSALTRCAHPTFPQKVDHLFSKLNLASEDAFKDELKNIFKFSSEFTHIGYVSTFFTSSLDNEVIFGDDIGPYLLSTENFSELKYQILETVTRLFSQVYLPILQLSLRKILVPSAYKGFEKSLGSLANEVTVRLKTRNSQYYFFIKKGLIGTNNTIDLPCMCGKRKSWNSPHDKNELYCKNCGSHFNLIEVDGDGGYIITSTGPIKIIGTEVPEFGELPIEEQIQIMKKIEDLKQKKDNPAT